MIQNLHSHTTFCDGKNTAEEMLQTATKKGLKSYGFSGHSPIPVSNDYCMTYENIGEYKNEVLRLKEKYAEKIEVFLGIETEALYEISLDGFDYSISSAHDVIKDGNFLEIDYKKSVTMADIEKYYGGNAFDYIEDYYKMVIEASKRGDILGHFDLVTKFNRDNDIFDEHGQKYREIAISALDECLKSDIIIEINTGAIQRGYRDSFYPADFILDRLLEKKAKIIIGSDAHVADGIDFFYDETVEVLKSKGFSKQMELRKNGFVEVEL